MQQMVSRRSFVTTLGMVILPFTALAQDNKTKNDKTKEEKEEKKKDAQEKKEDAKDNAKDAVEDHDNVADGPGRDAPERPR